MVNNNKGSVKPFSNLVNAAYRACVTHSWDPLSQGGNENVEMNCIIQKWQNRQEWVIWIMEIKITIITDE